MLSSIYPSKHLTHLLIEFTISQLVGIFRITSGLAKQTNRRVSRNLKF